MPNTLILALHWSFKPSSIGNAFEFKFSCSVIIPWSLSSSNLYSVVFCVKNLYFYITWFDLTYISNTTNCITNFSFELKWSEIETKTRANKKHRNMMFLKLHTGCQTFVIHLCASFWFRISKSNARLRGQRRTNWIYFLKCLCTGFLGGVSLPPDRVNNGMPTRPM